MGNGGSKNKTRHVLVLGLEGAGKHTILAKLGDVTSTIAFIGHSVEKVQHNNLSLVSWNVGGSIVKQMQHLLRGHYENAEGIIFVVDAADRDGIHRARDELRCILAEDDLRESALLVFVNKMDAPIVMSPADTTDELGLNQLQNRPWHVQACCGITGDGLYDGLDWLTANFSKQ